LITASVYLVGAFFYYLLASGERQDWSRIEGEERYNAVEENTFVSEATTVSANSEYGATEKK
jgi:hypothetical protein